MADPFEYVSKSKLEYRYGYRHAYLGDVPAPVVYGVQGALREYYGVAEGPPVECVGDACRDLEYGPEEIAACHLVNQGRREIAVDIVKSGSREPSISASVAPGRTIRLEQPIMGCQSAQEIGRIEARYK